MRIYFYWALVMICFTQCNQKNDGTVYQNKITGASIIDVETGELITGKDLFTDKEGIIHLLDEGNNFKSLNTIDATGKYLIPALWDMHVHFRGGEELIGENKGLLPLYVANGVTTVRDAGGDLTSAIYQWREEIENERLTGPYIYTSGPKIDGPGARWAGSLEVATIAQADAALDSLENLKVDFVKLYESKLSGEMYLYLLEECQKRNLKVSGHMPFTVMLQDAIDRKVTSIEHLYYVLKGCSSRETEITEKIRNGELGFWGSMQELIASYDDSLATVRFKNMKDANTFVVPTLHIGHVLSYLDQDNHTDDKALNLIGKGIKETYQGRIKSAMSANEEAVENRHQLHQTFRKLVLKLQNSGVKLLAGSDGGAYNSYIYPGFAVHEELRIMVECGLTPLEALQTATINGPDYFGESVKKATLTENSTSDILILDENPLDNISNTRKIEGLIMNGKYINKTSLASLLGDAE